MADVVLDPTPALIQFRTEGPPIVIPAGTWNLASVTHLTLIGTPNPSIVTNVELAEGASIHVDGVTVLNIISLSSQGPGGMIEPQGSFHALEMFAGSTLIASGNGPVFHSAQFQAILIADAAVIEGGPGGSVLVDGSLYLTTTSGSIEDDAVVGTGTGYAAIGSYYIGSGPGTYGFTQSGLASWNPSRATMAPLINYESSAPANWAMPLPTTVQEGLDALAARLGPP